MFLQSAGDGAQPARLSQDARFGAKGPVGVGSLVARPTPGALTRWDLIGMLAGFLLVLAITVVNSRGRVFWEDEMLGWLLLRDPSWTHMIRAWNLGADGGGFSFYLLGRAWFRLFGDSALAFRLFSSTCFGLAFAVLWAALRRVYPLAIVAFAAFNTYFCSPPLTLHFLEGRFYGLLVLSTALALWLALRLDAVPEGRPAPTPRWLYLAAFLVHGLLTTSHVLGVVFSAVLLLATLILDRLRRRWRPGLYLVVAASWLLLIPERVSLIAAGRVGKPHFWTKAPGPKDVLGAYTGFSHEVLLVLLALGCLLGLALWRSGAGLRTALREAVRQRTAAYAVTLCLLLVPVAFLAEGLVGTWLFNDRYLLPLALAVAFVTAELLELLREHATLHAALRNRPALRRAAGAAAGVLFAVFLLLWDFHHVARLTPEPVDFTGTLTAHLPHGIPVVVEDAFTFTELMAHEANAGVDYKFLLDWPWAVNPAAPRLEVTQFHLMQNWKLAGYFPQHIEDASVFLSENPRFLVIHDGALHPDPSTPPEIGNPLAERLSHDPDYQVRPFYTLDRTYRDSARDVVWLVCRGGCGAHW